MILPNPAADAASAARPWKGSVLAISDMHLGMWGIRNEAYTRREKAAALRSMVRLANQHGSTILLNGDILDNRVDKRDLRRDCHLAREQWGDLSTPMVFLRGNHDNKFSARKIRKRLGNCQVVDGLVHLDLCGVAATHGHILDTKRARKLITKLGHLTRRQWKAMNRSLDSDAPLQSELQELYALDLAVAAFESIKPLRLAFERLECFVRSTRTWLSQRLRNWSHHESSPLHRWAEEVDLKSIRRAGQLALVLHGWCCVFGHNHTPGVYGRRVLDPLTGQTHDVLIGNSGSFVQQKQPITCLLAQHPNLTLLRYDREQDALLPMDSLSLEEAPAHLAPRSSARKSFIAAQERQSA